MLHSKTIDMHTAPREKTYKTGNFDLKGLKLNFPSIRKRQRKIIVTRTTYGINNE